jgi:hypothetical protein
MLAAQAWFRASRSLGSEEPIEWRSSDTLEHNADEGLGEWFGEVSDIAGDTA